MTDLKNTFGSRLSPTGVTPPTATEAPAPAPRFGGLRDRLRPVGAEATVAAKSGSLGALSAQTTKLLTALEDLKMNPSVALRVMWSCDDPDSSGAGLAAAMSLDPVMTARALKIANSAMYGLSKKVGTAAMAVSVLGFSTVRTIAASAAMGIGQGSDDVPADFWYHATLAAASASLIAPRSRVSANDAFSLGILHDVGRAMLHRVDPSITAIVDGRVAAGEAILDVERELYGIDHAAAAARVLSAWKLPDDLIFAIANHHRSEVLSPLTSTLAAAEVIAKAAMRSADDSDGPDEPGVEETLNNANVRKYEVEVFAAMAVTQAESLAPAIGWLKRPNRTKERQFSPRLGGLPRRENVFSDSPQDCSGRPGAGDRE